jgi:hypothetical protein
LAVARLVSSWIVAGTPGLTMNEPLGAFTPAIAPWWRPSRAPTGIDTAAAMLITNWPLLSVVTAPMPGTFSTRPGSGTLTSALKASLPVRVQAMTVTVVLTGAGSGAAISLRMPWWGCLQPAKPHSCLSLV